jgi:N-acetylneuraminate synthase
MNTKFSIGDFQIAPGGMPYIIAEIGVNHENSMERAFELIELAKAGGAHAAKFQSYKAATLASKHSPAYWDTSKEPTLSQRALFAKYDSFGSGEYRRLAAHCAAVGIDFLSTPFDSEAVDFLDELMPCYKIASADITNVPMLRKVASKGKPVVLSTGASTIGEIELAVATLEQAGCTNIALLHCVLNYPTENQNAGLRMLEGLARCFPDRTLGYSDHTFPQHDLPALQVAYLNGALILEKHFTHDKTLPGNDHYHAMDVDDLRRFRERLATITELQGSDSAKHPLPSEAPAREHARRSIVINRHLAAGAVLTEDDLTCKRPAHGISPVHWDAVIGRRLVAEREEDHVLQWSDLVA